jgi:hypothetical protein
MSQPGYQVFGRVMLAAGADVTLLDVGTYTVFLPDDRSATLALGQFGIDARSSDSIRTTSDSVGPGALQQLGGACAAVMCSKT